MANKKRNTKKTSKKKVEKKEEIIVEEKEKEIVVEEIKEEVQENDTNKKNTRLKFVMLIIQFFLSIVTLAFAITFIFNRNIVVPFQITLALTMFAMGINNILVYKRKFFTILYFLIGLILLVLAVLTIMGV